MFLLYFGESLENNRGQKTFYLFIVHYHPVVFTFKLMYLHSCICWLKICSHDSSSCTIDVVSFSLLDVIFSHLLLDSNQKTIQCDIWLVFVYFWTITKTQHELIEPSPTFILDWCICCWTFVVIFFMHYRCGLVLTTQCDIFISPFVSS